jgi:hypothetical protein
MAVGGPRPVAHAEQDRQVGRDVRQAVHGVGHHRLAAAEDAAGELHRGQAEVRHEPDERDPLDVAYAIRFKRLHDDAFPLRPGPRPARRGDSTTAVRRRLAGAHGRR